MKASPSHNGSSDLGEPPDWGAHHSFDTGLLENIRERPSVSSSIRNMGDVSIPASEGGVDIIRHKLRAALVGAAKKKAKLRKVDFTVAIEDDLMRRVYAALDAFVSIWRGAPLQSDSDLVIRATEAVDRALAILIGTTVMFAVAENDYEESPAPFASEESAFEWLQNGGWHAGSSYLPSELFEDESLPREIYHLWLARQFLEKKCERIYGALKLIDGEVQLSPRVFSSSRMAQDLQQLIANLCAAWSVIDPR